MFHLILYGKLYSMAIYGVTDEKKSGNLYISTIDRFYIVEYD